MHIYRYTYGLCEDGKNAPHQKQLGMGEQAASGPSAPRMQQPLGGWRRAVGSQLRAAASWRCAASGWRQGGRHPTGNRLLAANDAMKIIPANNP